MVQVVQSPTSSGEKKQEVADAVGPLDVQDSDYQIHHTGFVLFFPYQTWLAPYK